MTTVAPTTVEKWKAVAHSPLFTKLPGELRNHIITLAVVDEHPVLLTADGMQGPGLLSTCHLLRQEAGSIYYTHNAFEVLVDNYDSTGIMLALRKYRIFNARDRNGRGKVLALTVSFTPHRKNLMVWMRRVHARAMPVPRIDGEWDDFQTLIMGRMFEMAVNCHESSWDRVKCALLFQRRLLAELDPAWNVDHVEPQ